MSPVNEFVEGDGKFVGFRLELDPFSLAECYLGTLSNCIS